MKTDNINVLNHNNCKLDAGCREALRPLGFLRNQLCRFILIASIVFWGQDRKGCVFPLTGEVTFTTARALPSCVVIRENMVGLVFVLLFALV